MKSKITFSVLVLLIPLTLNAQMTNFCATPPFITQNVKPNIIIILDNSNSMDEDFYGNAVGSYASNSKSVVAKKALRNLISLYKDKLRVGLVTYRLSSDVRRYNIHNSFYFVSYDPKSYCPDPHPECVNYCQTGNTTAREICETDCQVKNPDFDVNYFDEIIINYPIGSEQRDRYCRLVYPKTQRVVNPSDSSHYLYFKHALPYYSPTNDGIAFCYSLTYDPDEGSPYDYYKCYYNKVGTSDDYIGYSNHWFDARFVPTDTDFALGYYDFGRRLSWEYVGRTWFSNTSPGDGYIHVEVGDLVTDSGGNSAIFISLWNKLDPKENDEDGYMSCNSYNKNFCPYIINAGLTPTAGTLQTVINYLEGEDTPIQYRCQKTFVIYVTDGLPSVDENGNTGNADELMPAVLDKISTLRNLSVTINGDTYNMDIKTYILGVGLTEEAKEKLDEMAKEGGTDVDGHAYYADNPEELYRGLRTIFLEILKQTSSGTSVSVLSERTEKGANMIQAVFHPKKEFPSGDSVSWIGFLNNFWLIRGETPETITLREDTDEDKALSPSEDMIMRFDYQENNLVINLYRDEDRDGVCDNKDVNGTCIADATADFDTVKKIWEAGELLKEENVSDRKIWAGTDLNGDNETDIDDLVDNTTAVTLKPYLLVSNDTEAINIMNYVKGVDIPGTRSRTVNGKVWKLGDIIYSTPQVVDYEDTSNPAKTYSVVYVGANDGMLHAFKLGKLSFKNLTGDHIAKLCDNNNVCATVEIGKELWAFIPKNSLPYLKYLMNPDYCHLYYVDLTPFVFEAGDRKVLIGGMRLGGACGCTSTNCVHPPPYYCKDASNNTISCDEPGAIPYCVYEDGTVDKCDKDENGTYDEGVVGYSSYFALDITDPENPKLLWEFSDPKLGFSYSGPAVMKINGHYYVAFASGPTNYEGKSDQNLTVFVLKLDDDFELENISMVDKVEYGDSVISLNHTFSGRIFTYKEDVNPDNPIFFGYVQEGSWKGGVLKLYPTLDGEGNPSSWNLKFVLKDIGPVTARVVETEVAGEKWLVFGEGRYFTGANDDPDAIRRIYGVKATCEDCFSELEDVTNEESGSTSSWGWYIRLDGPVSDYTAERMITDPVAVDTGYENVSFYVTFQPTSDICGYGGRTFVWAVTTTGGGIISNPLGGKLFVQLSTGQLAEITEASGRKTGPFTGVPSETAPAFVRKFSAVVYKGKIIHIIEK